MPRFKLLLSTVALLAVAAPAAHAGVTTAQPAYDVVVERNVVVPMTDGTRLVADIYRPAPAPGQPSDQRFPCLFEMTPYRKEARASEGANVFPARGFVFMEIDARGTGGSEGEYDGVFLAQEQVDGYDAIEWLATQYPHCNGEVGMWGGSYSGINQYLIAASPKGTPPHLRTLAPQRALSDLYRDIVHTGGIVTGSFGAIWAGGTTAYNAQGADPRTSPDPGIALNSVVHHLGNDPMLLTYINAPFDSPFYRESSVIDRLEQLDLPIYHLEGWYDSFTRGQVQAIDRLLELERDGVVSGPNYAAIGPWNHGGTHFFPHAPLGERIVDWYRHWLDDAERPAWFDEPRISYCVMQAALDGPCEWRAADEWPVPGTQFTRWHLQQGGALSTASPPASGKVGSWAYNPTAGTGEAAFSKWDNAAGVPQRDADQAREDEFKGLSFTTAPLVGGLTVTGPIVLQLRAATTPLTPAGVPAPLRDALGTLGQHGARQLVPRHVDTDFVVKLSSVDPAGRSTLIQSGFLRASHRALDTARSRYAGSELIEPFHPHTESTTAPVQAGVPTDYAIEVWPTSKRFQPGHRLRITLYSADTPNHLTLPSPVLNDVLAGSYLLLPHTP